MMISVISYIKVDDEVMTKDETIKKDDTVNKVTGKYYVDIKGAVKNPGVYKLKEKSRVIDQTTPNMIQRISGIFERKPLISRDSGNFTSFSP